MSLARDGKRLGKVASRGLAALVALAFACPAAFADASLEVTEEFSGHHCPPISVATFPPPVTGGCGPIHYISTSAITLRTHIFGVEGTDNVCNTEFDLSLDENGDGYIHNQHLEGAACSREPCEDDFYGYALPWRFIGREDATGEYLRLSFCVSTTTDMADRPQCTVDIPFETLPDSHSYLHLGVLGGGEMPGIGPAGFRCELHGHWVNEGPVEAEISHS